MTMSSGVYIQTFKDLFSGGTTPAWTHLTDALTGTLHTDTETPDYEDTTNTYASLTNEVAAGGGYSTGGKALDDSVTTRALTISGGDLQFFGTLPAWTASTISAEGTIIHNGTTTTQLDQTFCAIDFLSTIASSSGSFTVTLDGTSGYVQLDLTP